MTEFQAALLLQQLTRVEEQSELREQNAQYLTGLLREIPGISPARMYDGATRNGYHLYMLRYDKAHFADLPRARFLEALEQGRNSLRARLHPAEHATLREGVDSFPRLSIDLSRARDRRVGRAQRLPGERQTL